MISRSKQSHLRLLSVDSLATEFVEEEIFYDKSRTVVCYVVRISVDITGLPSILFSN